MSDDISNYTLDLEAINAFINGSRTTENQVRETYKVDENGNLRKDGTDVLEIKSQDAAAQETRFQLLLKILDSLSGVLADEDGEYMFLDLFQQLSWNTLVSSGLVKENN